MARRRKTSEKKSSKKGFMSHIAPHRKEGKGGKKVGKRAKK